ncbi:unnamed protein product [Clonostachys rosea]|uniref:MalT-like TPR region domain-containing protein n=1 Tax=Bionectria ochroleuca TaxID=29856 RepID=A0ABY6V145_BIOOC|nr:unnamed protein product [Clonostachys rosea]
MEFRSLFAKFDGIHDRKTLGHKLTKWLKELQAQPELNSQYSGVDKDKLFDAKYRHIEPLRAIDQTPGVETGLSLIFLDQLGRVYSTQASDEVFGPAHLPTLQTMLNLGLTHKNQGRYPEAESIFKRILRLSDQGKKKLRRVDFTTNVHATCGLALVHQTQGRHREAEPFFKQFIKECEEAGDLAYGSRCYVVLAYSFLGFIY